MFSNYCIVVMGNTTGVINEIKKISEIKPNILDAKGILIGTFSSLICVSELTEWFTSCNRNFLLFNLNSEMSGFHLKPEYIQDGLFGFLDEIDVNKMTDEFLTIVNNNNENELSEIDINKLSQSEKNTLLNKLIDQGIDKLSEIDKKILQLLVATKK